MATRRAATLSRVSSLAPAISGRLAALVFPEGVLLFAAVVILQWETARESVATFAHFYSYAVLAAGLLLGWRFHRSRLLFALLILALADRALLYVGADGSASAGAARIVYSAVALLLPVNLVGLALLAERSTLTVRGLVHLAIILGQFGLVVPLYNWRPPAVAVALAAQVLPEQLAAWTPVTQPALLAFGAAAGWLTVRVLLQPVAMERGFLWALVACFLAIGAERSGAIPTIYFATAGLVLIAAVIETSYHMAYRDGLTGLPARRALNEALHRLGGRYTVAMVDVDRFKRLNDTHGHDVGDQVLRMVAAHLAKVGGGGKAFRYGGEEFAILFSGKDLDDAVPHLEALRRALENTKFSVRARGRPRKKPKKPKVRRRSGKKVSLTVSIGAAERARRDAAPEETIKAADDALYRAKKAGRNRVKT